MKGIDQMSFMRVYVLLFFVTFLWSCQGNKSDSSLKKENLQVTKKQTKDTLKKAVTKPKLGTLGNPYIKEQAQLKDFLLKYGKENPETHVRLTTNFGIIEVQLYNDTPLHRANFILLVKEGYFDLTEFHRVSPGFVDQFGNNDSYKTSRKRAGIGKYLLPNESKTKYKHHRGALAAAKYREQNQSNASHPFENYIVVSNKGAHHLNGEHTVFGRVTKGMAVVDKINEVPIDQSEWPREEVWVKAEIIK